MSTGILDKPSLGACQMSLYDYQDAFVDSVRGEFRRGIRATMGILATGGGKTICFGHVARRTIEKGGRVLILAHTDELVEQAVAKLDYLGVTATIEKAQSYARAHWEPDAVVACVPTLTEKRLATWPRDYFKLIITDECHHAIARSYQRIYKHFSQAWHLGVTATPDRGDEESLYKVYQTKAFEASYLQLATAPAPGPYLCRLIQVSQDLGLDFAELRTKKEDFTKEMLEERIRPHVETLCNWFKQKYEGRPFMIFTPMVASSQAVASGLQDLGIKCDWVSGDDPDREEKVRRAKAGDLHGLVNAMVLTEGVDWPECACVGIFRPTKSRPLLAQMIGRGTRRGKPDCLILDPGFLFNDSVISPVELLDASWIDPETISLAAKEAKSGQAVDLLDAIEKADVVRREQVRVKIREREIKGRCVSYDPVAVYETMGLPWRGPKECKIHTATPGQVQYLAKLGITGAEKISKMRASTMIDFARDRMAKGLATTKQVSWLIARGVEPEVARNMTLQEASAKLDELFGQRRRA